MSFRSPYVAPTFQHFKDAIIQMKSIEQHFTSCGESFLIAKYIVGFDQRT